MTSRIWGYVYDAGDARAVYFVEWTPGHEPKQANYDLIIGTWGEGTVANDRNAVSLEFRTLDTGPTFMVIDASDRSIAKSPLVSKALKRADVIGTPFAAEVFAICDIVYLEDSRVAEFRD